MPVTVEYEYTSGAANNRRDPAHPNDINNSVNTKNSAVFQQSINTNSIYYHKCLDLSNVGLVMDKRDCNDKWLRQFHQTRIYVRDFYKMRHHTKVTNGLSSDRNLHIISANLPESVSYRIGSSWEQPLSFGDASFNLAMQTLGKSAFGSVTSGVNRVSSLKVWNGSTPLQLSLRIPVIDDGYNVEDRKTGLYTNLAEALEFLSCLCLPSSVGTMGFYNPPPSPLNFQGNWSHMSEEYAAGLDEKAKSQFESGLLKKGLDFLSKDWNFSTEPGHITLQLGGMLMVEDIIVESVNVEYPNTKGQIRHSYNKAIAAGDIGTDHLTPLLAYLVINVSTIENLTSESYSKMLWIKKDQGQGSVNVENPVTALNSAKNLIRGGISAADRLTGGAISKASDTVGGWASSAVSTTKEWYGKASSTASDAIQSSSSWLGEHLDSGIDKVADYFGADGDTKGTLKSCVQDGLSFGADAASGAISSAINNAVTKNMGGNALVCKVTGLAADKVSVLATETVQNVASNVSVKIKPNE